MINLLSIEEKKELISDYRRRRLVVWLMVILSALVLAILMLSSCWVMLSYRTLSLAKVLNSKKYEISNKSFDSLSQTVKSTNDKLTIFLANTGELAKPSAVLKQIVDKRRSGIRILGISYERKDGTNAAVTVRGKSNDRNAVLGFADALRKDPLFVSVDSPISNIIRQTNSDFNITTSVKFTE